MDVLTKAQRRKAMQHIRGKDTSIEVKLRKALWHKGYRYRKNYKKLPGSPDIAITKYKIAIFCDSEFFHGKDFSEKKEKIQNGTHGDYWVNKIDANIERDLRTDKDLASLGWTVLHFWGGEINKNLDECVKTVEEEIFKKKIEGDK